MIAFSWLICQITDDAERAEVSAQIPALLCEHFQLCAGVGCQCVTGNPDHPQHCQEQLVAYTRDHHVSQGPTWHANVTALVSSIRIDLYLDGPLIGSEHGAFMAALGAFKRPVFEIHGAGMIDL